MRIKKSRDRFQSIRKLTLFAGMNDRELARVVQLLTPISLRPGARLTTEGTSGRQAFIILAGTAEVTIAGQIVATAGPGDVIGEMALLDGRPRTATVTTLEEVEAFVLDPRSFNTLLDQQEIARKVLTAEVDRLRAANSAQATVAP